MAWYYLASANVIRASKKLTFHNFWLVLELLFLNDFFYELWNALHHSLTQLSLSLTHGKQTAIPRQCMGPICIWQSPRINKVSLDWVVSGQITEVDECWAVDVRHTALPKPTHSTCMVDLDEGFPRRVNSVESFICMRNWFIIERKIN